MPLYKINAHTGEQDRVGGGGGGGAPGGASGSIQYNNDGAFGGIAAAQGDLLYGSATNAWSKLAKNTTATRYLANTGSSNSPAWAQVNLTNGVTGTLPFANGGTGATSFAANRIPYSTGSVLTSSAALTETGSVFNAHGVTLQAFLGSGGWIGFPSGGPAALGLADSVGGVTYIAHATGGGQFMTNAMADDVIYRTGSRILWGAGDESGGYSQMMLSDHWLGIGDGMVPLAPLHVRRAQSTAPSCGGDNSTPTCTGDNSSPNTCFDQMDEGSCSGAGCTWNDPVCEGDNSVPNTCPDFVDESNCNSNPPCAWGSTANTCPDALTEETCVDPCAWDPGNGYPAVTWDFRLDYDASNYLSVTMATNGNATFDLVGTSPKFIFNDEASFGGVSGDGTGKVVCIKSDGTLGTCTTTPTGGSCTCT